MVRLPGRDGAFTGLAAIEVRRGSEKAVMTDIILIVAGTGGILLMAAYAIACEHI